MSHHVRIGITAGDFNGIGPEVAIKALRNIDGAEIILIGDVDLWRAAVKKFRGPKIDIWNPAPSLKITPHPGTIRVDAARAAATYIRAGAQACLEGYLDGLVTAPIAKEGFHRAGIDVPGHTEMLAQLTGTKRYAMMLFGGPLRVVIATRHIPLSAVPSTITGRLIREHVALTAQGLAWMGLKRRRVAVCGLNPHAGEGGDIGREEITTIAPAIKALRRAGHDVHGPLPGDTVFHEAARGDYDAVVAMYHDQGLAPLKLLAFDTGVNLTLGLPIVRTSPDHGTAFALAGQNRANPESMRQAILAAIRLAARPNPWKRHAHA